MLDTIIRQDKHMKIVCPVSREENIKKDCKKSLYYLHKIGYSIEIIETLDPGNVSDCVDLNETEHLFVDSDIGPFGEEEINILRGSHCEVVSGAYEKYVENGKILGNYSYWQGGNNAFVAGMWGSLPGLVGSFVKKRRARINPNRFLWGWFPLCQNIGNQKNTRLYG